MTRDNFEQTVDWAIAAVPERFRAEMGNLAFVVEETAPEDEELLGLYEGIPLTERTLDDSGLLPDLITIYMDETVAEAEETGEPLDKVIRETVWHEIAHYFGFDEEDAERLCGRWEENWPAKSLDRPDELR